MAKIIDLCPDSIHTIRIRNRLTLLRIRALQSAHIMEDARLLGYVRQIAADIKEGLAAKSDDILELDILSEAATKLFLKLEWVDEMEMTCKILDERYPETEQAETAREELAKLKTRKGS